MRPTQLLKGVKLIMVKIVFDFIKGIKDTLIEVNKEMKEHQEEIKATQTKQQKNVAKNNVVRVAQPSFQTMVSDEQRRWNQSKYLLY